MPTVNLKTYLLPLAAVPYFLLGSQAAPAGLAVRGEEPVLFADGGAKLDDIAIKGQKSERDEKGSIVSQCLIAATKLNPSYIDNYFWRGENGDWQLTDGTIGVRPYWNGISPDGKDNTLRLSLDDAKKTAAEAGGDGMKFGYEETAAWWPYAYFAGIKAAGWGRKDDKELSGAELAVQTLNLVTGFESHNSPQPSGNSLLDTLMRGDSTPVLLNIKEFDSTIQEHDQLKAPKDLRWEAWVTVMSYVDDTKVLEYATSYHDDEDKRISQWIHIDDIEITNMVTLLDFKRLDNAHLPAVATEFLARRAKATAA